MDNLNGNFIYTGVNSLLSRKCGEKKSDKSNTIFFHTDLVKSDWKIENEGNSRLLGHHEQLFYNYNKGNNSELYVSINIIQSKKQHGGEITLQQVRGAFHKVSQMNFMMHACVKLDGEADHQTPRFYPMSEKRLLTGDWMQINRISLVDDKEENWEQAIPIILEKGFNYSEGPLWSAWWGKLATNDDNHSSPDCTSTIDNKYILFFVCSHMIIDGKSGLNLICNQLIPLLNNSNNNAGGINDEKQLQQVSSTPTHPEPIYFAHSKEEIFDGYDQHQMELANRPMPFHIWLIGTILSWKSSASRWLWGEPKPTNIKHHYKKFLVNQKHSQTLVRVCKSREKSVHAVLMSLVYNAMKDASTEFDIDLRKDIVFVVDRTKFDTRMSDPSHMPMGTYHHISKHFMRPVALDDEQQLFKMVDEVMITIKETNVPQIKPSVEDNLMYIFLKNGLLTADLVDLNILSNMGNGDAINTYDKNGSREVVLTNHYFCVPESRFKLTVFVNSFRERLHVVIGHNTLQENEPYCASIAQKIEENITDFVMVYG